MFFIDFLFISVCTYYVSHRCVFFFIYICFFAFETIFEKSVKVSLLFHYVYYNTIGISCFVDETIVFCCIFAFKHLLIYSPYPFYYLTQHLQIAHSHLLLLETHHPLVLFPSSAHWLSLPDGQE